MTRRLQPLVTEGTRLQTTTDPRDIEEIQHEIYKQRHKLPGEREAEHRKSVLENIKGGGWGKQAMERWKPRSITTSSVSDMEHTHRDGQNQIRDAATRYYKDLFEDKPEDNMQHDEASHTLRTKRWDVWELKQCLLQLGNGDDGPRRDKRGGGGDGLVCEVWRMAAWADERLAAQIAWASNIRVANDPSLLQPEPRHSPKQEISELCPRQIGRSSTTITTDTTRTTSELAQL